MPDTAEAVGQDNREPGENPGRSRRCVSGAFFQPKGSHCENGKTKKCGEAKVRRPAFLLGIIGSAMDGHLYILSEFGLFDRRELLAGRLCGYGLFVLLLYIRRSCEYTGAFFMKIDYYAYQSGMKHWNAGLKVFLALGTLCLTVGVDKLWVSLFVFLSMSGLTLFAGRLPGRVYFHFLLVPFTFAVFSTLVIAIQLSLLPVGEWQVRFGFFYLCSTRADVITAGEVLCKAMAGVSALYMMSLSTPVSEFVMVLGRLHLPRLLVELMNLIYRYIFILFDVAAQLQTAAKARLGNRNLFISCKTFAGVAGNLFILSLKKAGAYYDALLARGYNGRLEFLTDKSPIAKGQIAFIIIYFIVLGAVAVLA